MNYEKYTTEDFALDESFRTWVLVEQQHPKTFWGQWLGQHPEKAKEVRQAIGLVRHIMDSPTVLDRQQLHAISQKIEAGIDAFEQDETPVIHLAKHSAHRPERGRLPLARIAVAACLLLALGSAAYVAYHTMLRQDTETVVYVPTLKRALDGQKRTIYLPDGSQVVLNAGSSIRYTQPFESGRRRVTLEGEAFFEVATDSLHPFQVQSGELTTTVLGTSFNIAAYPTDSVCTVSLATGRVRLAYGTLADAVTAEYTTLRPGEQIRYNSARQRVIKESFDAHKVFAWKSGIIYLENATEATVLKTLERWYGLPIRVEGKSTKVWNVNATFDRQSLENVLTSLSYTIGFSFEIKDNYTLIKY